MAIQIQGNGGTVGEVSGTTFRALRTEIKPLEYGSLGHYRFAARINSTAAQAANSRIFEIRNTSTNLIIPTRLSLSIMQTAAGTAQENSIDLYRCTSFTAVDTTNTTTPTISPMRATMAAAPGGAAVRILNPAAAGMTGGTLTKDSTALYTAPYNVATAISTTWVWQYDMLNFENGECPPILAQNEGLILENRVLNVTSMGVTWFISFSWAEVASF